uniref:helix-turn-helix transcriptional regulator n=1 Tax=Halopiger goleimassiliensis TaxID=1293048 RepID=UPI0006781000|nr:MarR family transcriptional regulator [Halopiger goleimassiliensis]
MTRSANRPLLLEAIDERPSTPSELVDRYSISRATVQRILSDFETHGWITKRDGEYHLTAAGAIILETYDHAITRVEQVLETEPVLRRFDPGNEPPLQPLSESTIVVPTDERPHAPVLYYREQAASRSIEPSYIVDPIVNSLFTDVHQDLYEANDAVDVIVESAFESHVTTDRWLKAVAPDDLYVYSGDLSIGLVLSERNALAILYDADRSGRVCIDCSNEELRRWFASYAESKKASARRFAEQPSQ